MQTLPPETIAAFFPQSAQVGNLRLKPLTIAGAAALAALGIDVNLPVEKRLVGIAAFVLSEGVGDELPTNAEFEAWLERAHVPDEDELSRAVARLLNEALSTYRKPPEDPDAPKSELPQGCGWPLDLAAYLTAECGLGWAEARNLPVTTAWALVAAARYRHRGGKCGITYLEKWAWKMRRNHG